MPKGDGIRIVLFIYFCYLRVDSISKDVYTMPCKHRHHLQEDTHNGKRMYIFNGSNEQIHREFDEGE